MGSDIIPFYNTFSDLTPEETQTAQEEWKLIGAALERKSHCLEDDMVIAQSLDRIKAKHSSNSNLYRNYLTWLGSVSPAWQDADYRKQIKKTYDGYKLIQSCGSPEETTKSISKYNSHSALAEASKCSDSFGLAKALQRRKEPITAAEQKQFNKTGSFIVERVNLPTQSDTVSLSEYDKVLLLNLYINHYLKKHPPTVLALENKK